MTEETKPFSTGRSIPTGTLSASLTPDMGINGPKKFLITSAPLQLVHVVNILKTRANQVHCDDDSTAIGTARRAVLDIDANQVGFNFINKPGGEAYLVYICATLFLKEGVDVCIVADGPTRHDSKRASSTRKADRLRSEIECMKARIELAALLGKMFCIWYRRLESIRAESCTARCAPP
jgi:hypothetical protein